MSTKLGTCETGLQPEGVIRARECAGLQELIEQIGSGKSAKLQLRGEAGIGKTWLLDFAAKTAASAEVQVLRTKGLEPQRDLAYAAIHELLTPLLGNIHKLPPPQQAALNSAFGKIAGVSPDKFLVALSVLSLLSEMAEEVPLLCLVDDVQWLDVESAQILGFVARRLQAERIGIVFSLREPSEQSPALAEVPEVRLARLSVLEANELLSQQRGVSLSAGVRERLITESEGNPLALVEFVEELNPDQRAGRATLPEQLQLSSRIEERFLDRVRRLPDNTQTLLLLVAADPSLEVTTFWRAAASLRLSCEDSTSAETAGLLTIGRQAAFRHPLVRSAVYAGASSDARRQVHAAIAAVLDPNQKPERSALHRALAATVPDESVANALEIAAQHAKQRGALASAAGLLERASRLSPDANRATGRLLAAVVEYFEAGNLVRGKYLLDDIEVTPGNPLQYALAQRLRGRSQFALGHFNDVYPFLYEAARALEPIDLLSARETHFDALKSVQQTGSLGRTSPTDAACAVRPLASPRECRAIDLCLDVDAALYTEGHSAAAPIARRTVQALRNEGNPLLGALFPVLSPVIAMAFWDDKATQEFADGHVEKARSTGALGLLPYALNLKGLLSALPAGRFEEAAADFLEARSIAAATGTNMLSRLEDLQLEAWRGREAEALALAGPVIALATACGSGLAVLYAHHAMALLHNGLGKHDRALAYAQLVCQPGLEKSQFFSSTLPELIEAATHCGKPELASDAVEVLAEHTIPYATPWALGVLAQSRALVAEPSDATAFYEESIEHLGKTRIKTALARTHLLYGEWLRRHRHHGRAREQLMTAHDLFEEFGAAAFAARARTALSAVGGRARGARKAVELTSQEARIATLATEGLTNTDIAARLFLSAHTVKFHLGKVFSKLKITSRAQLAEALRKVDVVP